ncbi:MAG: sigma-54-dependent transcriptional regulator, partial [Thermoanaerobaculum sp.]
MALVLLIEDEQLLRWSVARWLEQAGFAVHQAGSIAEARDHLRQHRPDIVLLDLSLPDGFGLNLIEHEGENLRESEIIVVTASGSVEDAVRAMKMGAFDFLTKPVSQQALLEVVHKACAWRRNYRDAEGFRRMTEAKVKGPLIAHSPAMLQLLEQAKQVAAAPTTVLIHGETGVGKEVLARFIHAHSPRARGSLQAINCAAIPEQLVESELFGYEKGAFTDARESRKGIFELADGGTVILDEVAEIPLALQSKLLRFLEERTLRRLGGTREIRVDVRVIAITNRDLEAMVAEGKFRADLFYRLNVFPLWVPPLRQRPEDILPLAHHFLQVFAKPLGKRFSHFAPQVEAALLQHSWPGNVRELRNLMERTALLEEGGVVAGRALSGGEVEAEPAAQKPTAELVPLDELEFRAIVNAMRASKGNQSEAARLLRISRDQLRYRVKQYRTAGRWPRD